MAKKPKMVDPQTCWTCGSTFDAVPRDGVTTYVMPQMFGPTEYACSTPCFATWKRSRQVERTERV